MDCHKIYRAHESSDHIRMKRQGITSLRRRGFTSIFPEHYNCDLVAVRRLDSRFVVVGVEFERSPRNVMRNVTRNYSNGCHYCLVVASDISVYASCVRKLQKYLHPDSGECTFIITYDDFIAGRMPCRSTLVDLCSDFVQGNDPVCSGLFSFVQAPSPFVHSPKSGAASDCTNKSNEHKTERDS